MMYLLIMIYRRYNAAGVLSTTRFEGNSLMGWSATLERTKSVLGHFRPGDVIEWMIHAGNAFDKYVA